MNDAATIVKEAEMDISTGFVGHLRLLEIIWPDPAARPGLKWLQRQRAKRIIPFVKVGRIVCYDANRVRASLAKRFEVSAAGEK